MFQHNEQTFHLTGGLFFERLPDGWVRIRKQATPSPDSALVFEVITDASGWESIVAAMQGPASDSAPNEAPEGD